MFLGVIVRHRAQDAADVDPDTEERHQKASEVGGRHLRNIDVGKGDEVPVGQADQDAASVQAPERGRADLDARRDEVDEARHPDARSAAKVPCKGRRGENADNGADVDERSHQLLSLCADAPSNLRLGVAVAKDLEETDHGLEPSHAGRVIAILAVGQGHGQTD